MSHDRSHTRRIQALSVAFAMALGGLVAIQACQQESSEPLQPAASTVQQAPTPAPTPARAEVKGPEIARIAARVAGHVDKGAPALKPRIDALLTATGTARKAVASLYPDRQLRYYGLEGNLTEDGLGLVELLGHVDRHGIDRRGYRLKALDEATQGVVEAFAAERRTILAVGHEAGTARVCLAITGWLRTGQGGEIALLRAGGDDLGGAARKAIDAHLDKLNKAANATRLAVWKADVALSAAAVRYVVDMLWARPAHPHDFTTPATIRRMAESKSEEIIERLKDSRGHTTERLRALWPTHPQYALVLRAIDRYDQLATDGGWKKLPPMSGKKVVRGAKGAFVNAMRERLVAEGYDVGTGEGFDEDLEKAVIAFQDRHHLSGDGVVGKGVVAAMDVSAEQRARQLRLALQRLRVSNCRDPKGKNFVYVNIAAQRMFFYENGKVLRAHKVIVGKDNEDIDYAAQIKGKINRTKMFKATMTKVTLAPRWYPTQRVIDLELGPALAKDPDYYEKHGYVSEMNPDGSERVYQMSGKSNLLGVVKFQFPNKHSIYMHDTPSRGLFRRARRAYSHGCIRMEKPRQFAYLILGRERRGYTRKRINEIIGEREEKIVFLKRKIPVHIDYVSARVNRKGKVVFNSDIYAYDLAYFTGQLPVEVVQEYKPASLEGI